MAQIDFGIGPNTQTGDKVSVALAKLQARLDLLSGVADTTPDAFNFTSQANVKPGTARTSNAITVSGLSPGVSTPITVATGSYIKNAGSATSAPGTVQNGDTIKAFHNASSGNGSAVVTVVTIGGVSGTFTSTTEALDTTPDAFIFTDVVAAGKGQIQTSNTITVSGINTPVAVSITGGTYSKNGGAYTSAVGTALVDDTFSVRHTSSGSDASPTNTTLTIGGVSDTFTSTTPSYSGGPTPTNTVGFEPEISGTPRVNETAWFGAGEWPGANYYRYKLFLNGVQEFSTAQAGDALAYDWVAGNAGKLISGTVEASSDGGANYSAPVAMVLSFPYLSDFVEPATIAAPVLARTSSSGTTPMTFTVTGSPYPSYFEGMKITDSASVLIWQGRRPITEADLVSPYTPTGSYEWQPSDPPALGATDRISTRFESNDFFEGDDGTVYAGVASAWSNILSPTDIVFSPLTLSPTLWLDASTIGSLYQDSAGTTAVTAAAQPVGRWSDKSGGGKHFTQGTSGARGAFRQTGGRNSIEFDGVDDGLVMSSGSLFVATSDIFIVLTNSNNDTGFVTMWDTGSPGGQFFGVVESGSGSGNRAGGFAGASNLVNGVAVSPDTRGGLYTALGTTTKTFEVQNGTGGWSSVGIGNYGTFEANVHFHEILVFPTLSSGDRTTVRNYLASKWSIV